MNFASDNTARIAAPILAALERANCGPAPAYGNDPLTAALEQRFSALFEREVAVFLVATGTAANALALAHLSPPWGAVFCHERAHIATDECGAPEFFGDGLKLVGLPGQDGKLAPAALSAALASGRGPPHAVRPALLSLTQATECGTVYTLAEIAALTDIARRARMAVHMDGARFANAVAALGCSPADITWRAGVDVLAFGATKGGALGAEAIVFFDPERARDMDMRRMRAGQLLSKHRFAAAQFDAFLADDLWLDLARHANGAARRLAAGLTAAGLAPLWPVEANEVFVRVPSGLDARLKAAGALYYAWPEALDADSPARPDSSVIRLVSSFTTTDEEVDNFIQLIRMPG
jgi:threonine aldolase